MSRAAKTRDARDATRGSKTRTREHSTTLTKEQLRAVTHERGPLLVLAGAGTGKTRVLVERIAWLVRARHVPPQHMLALTFTERAANELQTRVDDALPLNAHQPWIGTFHGFGEYALREFALRSGLTPAFRLHTAPEGWLLLKRHLFSLPLQQYRPLGNPTKFVAALVEFFSSAKDQGITPEALAAYAASANQEVGVKSQESAKRSAADSQRTSLDSRLHWRELAAAYRAYVDLQRKEGVLDFGDLLLETLRLLRDRPEVRQRLQERFPHILVDEFQDTNLSQSALLELLAAGDVERRAPPPTSLWRSLVVASDDDQAIYAFRGSNVDNVLRFRDRFPGTKIVVLTDNFRSPQPLLDHAYQLIQHNNPYRLEATAGVRKRLTASGDREQLNGEGAPAEHVHFPTEEQELRFVTGEILKLVDTGNAYRDIAILTRTNAQAAEIVEALLRADIPHVTAEARGLLARPEIKDVLAYFRLLASPTDGHALFRLLTLDALGIPPTDRARLLGATLKGSRTALEVLEDSLASSSLSAEAVKGVESLTRLLTDHLARYRTLRLSHVLHEFLQRSGVLKAAVQTAERHPEVLPNLQAFLSYLRALEGSSMHADLLDVLALLDAAVEGGEGPPAATLPTDTDAVRVLTVHAAKGLEFPLVFLAGAVADRFPSRNRHQPLELPDDLLAQESFADLTDREVHVLEERRLFYVALTRARLRFVVTSSAIGPGGRRTRKPSPFIAEADILSTTVPADTQTAEEQLALPLLEAVAPHPARDLATSLSATKINDYETCPWKYRFKYVLQVPTPPSPALSFGSTIHNVLRDVGREVAEGRRPTVADALRWYQALWIADGYESVEHEAERKASGTVALRTYLAAHPELLARAPLFIEEPFSLPLPSTRLTGRIDRVERLPDGTVVVTDFKTGAGKGKEAASDFQLSLYALAARRALGRNPDRLRLSFIEVGRDDETTRPEAEDETTIARVENLAQRIRGGDFTPTPGRWCAQCDFWRICDYAAR